jgi:predicted signal transduction protein with EAL and GGDEF domain
VGERYQAREQLVRLRRCVSAVTVGLIALVELFNLTIVGVPAVDCLLQWMVVGFLALLIARFSVAVAFRVHDRVEDERCRLAAELAARRWSQETVRRLAYHDGLTGLPNRALFNDRLEAALVRADEDRHELAVMMTDLDHFKDVNDKLDHTAGDLLLTKVGERLTALLRKSVTVSRMGGDEFLLLLPELECSDEALAVA